MEMRKAGIIGTGMYVPDGILANADFEAMVDTIVNTAYSK